MKMCRSLLVPGVALALAVPAVPAAAASCSVGSQGVSFGTYDPLSASSLDATGNVAISCDAIVSFTVSLDAGNGSYGQRRMTGGTPELAYNLYTDASRLLVWGDGSAGTSTVSLSSDSADIPVYGRIPARQDVAAGTYADIIVVTITY